MRVHIVSTARNAKHSGRMQPLVESTVTMAHIEGRKLGDFVVRERLGHGAFGTVYRAEQPLLRRDAVIKVLHQRGGDAKEWNGSCARRSWRRASIIRMRRTSTRSARSSTLGPRFRLSSTR
jgi:serine/threonine protein kinase